MSKIVLKERVFTPTGKDLGNFSAIDLEPFDLQYEESDMPQEPGGGGSDENKRVPDPKDDDKLEPFVQPESDNPSKGTDPFSDNSDSKGSVPKKFDREGNDIDTENPYQNQLNNTDDQDDLDGSDNPDDSDDSGNSSSNNNSDNGDISDKDWGSDSGEDSPQRGENSSNGNSSSNPSDTQSGDNSEGQNESESQSTTGDSGEEGYSGNNFDDIEDEKEGYNEDDSVSRGNGKSDLEKSLDKMRDKRTESQKTSDDFNEKQAKEEEDESDSTSRGGNPNQAQAAKDAVERAAQESQKKEGAEGTSVSDEDENTDDSKRSASSIQNEVLSELGAGALTPLINVSNKKDWRSKLNDIFDKATGIKLYFDPNRINKKIEDAPPGSENETPEVKKVVVLLDCSGSMGAVAFKEVISQIDTMVSVKRELKKTQFYIFGWSDESANRILNNYYTKCKGKLFKKTIMAGFRNSRGGTYLNPCIQAVMSKGDCKNADVYMIFTDGKIADRPDSNTSSFFRRYKKRIIWVYTSNSMLQYMNENDPYAKQHKMYIKFKKGS